jgi:hypothetical protein
MFSRLCTQSVENTVLASEVLKIFFPSCFLKGSALKELDEGEAMLCSQSLEIKGLTCKVFETRELRASSAAESLRLRESPLAGEISGATGSASHIEWLVINYLGDDIRIIVRFVEVKVI